jgi:hypothetical protein
MYDRLQLKNFPGVIPPDSHSRGNGPPRGVGKGKGGDGGVVERRRGEEGGKGGGEGKEGNGRKELRCTTFECPPPRLTLPLVY